MRLSEAILAGSALKRLKGGGHSTPCGKHAEGCALELALTAVGRGDLRWDMAPRVWGWLADNDEAAMDEIWERFDRELRSENFSLEAFVDWVRSIEPDTDDGLPLQGTCAVPECGNDRIGRLEELCREHRDEAEAGVENDRSEHSRAIQGR